MARNIRYALGMLRNWLKPEARYLDPNVPLSNITSHKKWLNYLVEFGNKKGMRILEIGSREVTGESNARARFSNAEYVGFDYYPGRNVDVVGDAHKLSQYFANQEFDVIFTSACFEHFAMPWIVAAEMNKLLKVGGLVLVETHFSFSSHERPWHFFQFSDMGLRVLFPEAMGIQCIEAGMSNPIVGRFSALADRYLRFNRVRALYCHSAFLGRKVYAVQDFSWSDLDIDQVVGDSKYPKPVHPAG